MLLPLDSFPVLHSLMPPDDNTTLTATDFEVAEDDTISQPSTSTTFRPSLSPYRLPASEQLRGVANRIIFSRYYILFYFVMMTLSLTTVILSLIATSE